jgi:hypothetical protein
MQYSKQNARIVDTIVAVVFLDGHTSKITTHLLEPDFAHHDLD